MTTKANAQDERDAVYTADETDTEDTADGADTVNIVSYPGLQTTTDSSQEIKINHQPVAERNTKEMEVMSVTNKNL